ASGVSWTTSGTGSFSASATILNPEYVLTNADKAAGRVILRLTSTGNGSCKAVTDDIAITVTPAPTISAGIGQLVCADIGSIQLDGKVTVASGGSWTSLGTGSFSNSNILNSSYTLSPADTAAGTVSLVLTSTGNGSCQAVSDTVVYSIR